MRKKIFLLITIILLGILLLCYAIIPKNDSNNQTYENEINEYLEKKYNEKFNVKLIRSKQSETESVTCDGSTIWPAQKIDGSYDYYYEVHSEDNIMFNVFYIKNKENESFSDTYKENKTKYNIIDNIEIYVKDNIGNNKMRVEKLYEYTTDYSMDYYTQIDIYLDFNLKERLNKDYYDKIKLTNELVCEAANSYGRVDSTRMEAFEVYVHYKDNKIVSFANFNNNILIYNENYEYIGELDDLVTNDNEYRI